MNIIMNFNGMMKKYETSVNRNSKIKKFSMKKIICLLPASKKLIKNDKKCLLRLLMKMMMILKYLEKRLVIVNKVYMIFLNNNENKFYPYKDHPMPSFNRRGISGKGDSLVTKT